MHNNTIRIDEFDFERAYRPLRAQDGAWRSFDWTVPEEWDAVSQAARDGRVWTIVDSDGFVSTTSGLHFVNRLGYVITEVATPPDMIVDVYDAEELAEWEARVGLGG
jgi:hypothetical protein